MLNHFGKLRDFFVVLLIFVAQRAESITIKGSEPAYAGRTLEFMTWTDPVSKNVKSVFQLDINSAGEFYTTFEINEILFCFCDLGIYRGELILVPGEDFTLRLPLLKEKSFEESKNPYFEPVETWLKLEGGSDNYLTNLIARFDNRFYQLSDKYFNQLFYRGLKNYRDTIQHKLDLEFPTIKNPVFLTHRQWRLKSLEADMTKTGREKLIGTVSPFSVNDWNQPAFADVFNNLFTNTLSIESKSVKGSILKQWINQRNVAELKKWTENFISASSPLSDLVLLKMLHDAFYSGDFSKQAILQIIRSDYFSNHNLWQIRKIANEISSKLSYLDKGTTAPPICLTTLTNITWCSTSNTLPFLYVLFADLDIPICREQLKYLKTMAEKTGPNFQIVVIISPSKKVNIGEFISKNQIPGIILSDRENNITGKKYRVRSYPSAFLLDKNHKVLLAPAKTPLDGFEFQFAQFK